MGVHTAVRLCYDGNNQPTVGGSRNEMRQRVFERDGFKCVFCGADGFHGLDAHHLLERRLWGKDGGYHLDNLISVCHDCHLLCEMTLLTVEEGRAAANITNIIVPEHMYADTRYDKWGNVYLEDGRRSMGELFGDPSVQSILREAGVLDQFVPYVKYPRTYHLPWSHPSKDDRVLWDLSSFEGKEVVVTEKMDGENASIYNDYYHARTIDGTRHDAQSWARKFSTEWRYELPHGYRVCGENLYAKHSIKYDALPTYFMGFSVWDMTTCLSWDDTLEWFALLGITHVPILYEGVWDANLFRTHFGMRAEEHEGYVVRLRDSFTLRRFPTVVAKYVREKHVTTDAHWRNHFELNSLKE